MPFVSGSQGSGLAGRVLTALGNSRSPDMRHIALSPQADTEYSKLFGDYGTLLGNQKSNLADFTTQYSALTPQVRSANQEDAALYAKLAAQAAARNPIADMATIGDYGFGKLKDFGTQLYDYGLNQDNARLAAAGYGDRNPATNYAKILQSSRITGNLLPAFNNIISNIGPNYSRASQDYFNTLQAIPALMAGRYNALDIAPMRALVPSQIEQANLQSNIGNLGNLTQGQLNNWMFYVKPNALQTAGNVASGVYGGLYDAMDVANKAASTYGNLMSSGLGGQMGISGGQPQSSSNSIDLGQLLSMLNQGRGGGGGGGGGGAANIGQILQAIGPLLQQSRVQNNTGGPALQSFSLGAGAVQPYGQGTGEGYPLPDYYGGSFGNQFSSYASPAYGYNAYGSQNPYAQYGGYFE